jgi:hypothetical protein
MITAKKLFIFLWPSILEKLLRIQTNFISQNEPDHKTLVQIYMYIYIPIRISIIPYTYVSGFYFAWWAEHRHICMPMSFAPHPVPWFIFQFLHLFMLFTGFYTVFLTRQEALYMVDICFYKCDVANVTLLTFYVYARTRRLRSSSGSPTSKATRSRSWPENPSPSWGQWRHRY